MTPTSHTSSDRPRLTIPALGLTNRRQAGVVRRSQLYEAGWTRHQIDHELDVGRWQQLAPEVFCTTTGPLSYRQKLWLGVLHAGSGSALSHATACVEAGLRRWPSESIHVISRKSATTPPIPGFTFHETRRHFDQWILVATLPPRLTIEAAALLRAERERSVKVGIGVLAAVVQQELSTAEELYLVSTQIRKLRHGETLRLALADIACGAESFAEVDFTRICRDANLMQPTRQVIRQDSSGRRRFLDCGWELDDGSLIVLEIDGGFHQHTEHWWRDMKRERGLVAQNARVLRCSTVELRLEPLTIVADLRRLGVPNSRD